MLVITGIISQVEACLAQISSWNFTPLEFPYVLRSYTSKVGKSENHLTQRSNTVLYKFAAGTGSSSSHWIWHVVIFFSAVFSTLYQSIYEDKHAVEVSVHLLQTFSFTFGAILVHIQYHQSEIFVDLLNELLEFEKRHLSYISPNERKAWRQVKYRKLIVLGIHFFRVTFTLPSIAFPISVAFFPFAPWRHVPAGILRSISIINISGSLFTQILVKVTQGCISFAYSYAVVYLCTNRYLLLIILSIFASQASLIYMVHAFKIRVTKRNQIQNSVRMYREIQLLCSLFNELHKLHVIPASILIAMVGTSVSLFMLVSRRVDKDFQITFLFGNCLVLGIAVILLGFHFAVKLYSDNRNLLILQPYLRNTKTSTERRMMRKYWRSLPLLKIFFFQSNFFESTTPLVILDFSMNLAINLILLEN